MNGADDKPGGALCPAGKATTMPPIVTLVARARVTSRAPSAGSSSAWRPATSPGSMPSDRAPCRA